MRINGELMEIWLNEVCDTRIASLTRCRWGARHPIHKQVLELFLVGRRELGTLKQLSTIKCLNT